MDLLGNLLGGRGCSTDGSLTRNPITSMVDSVFNSHIAAGQHGQLPSSGDEQGYYMEQSMGQPAEAIGWQENYSASQAASNYVSRLTLFHIIILILSTPTSNA